jgi:uncharacterized integral membrane protein (TIGR00698 family)
MVAAIIALASQFIAEHYGAPAMLLALLFGIALNFLGSDPKCAAGIAFSAKRLLRVGVALLGLRISLDMVTGLGAPLVILVITAVVATIGFGLVASRFFGFRYRFAFLSAGAVAICGASAAMAIAAILPRDERSEDRLVFTVVGVTVLSTIAMILYPVISGVLDLDDYAAGIYLGATIHDVAQVVGAGFSISETAGETATLVKLLRVAMLAPIVVIASILIQRAASADEVGADRPPLLPVFVVGFVALTVLNSVVALPAFVTEGAGSLSRWLLLLAIAAVGLKTVPQDILKVGKAAAALLLAETVFLAVFVALGLWAIGLLPGPGT